MANLYDKAGLVNIPVGYQDGFLYNIKPEDNTLGFRFNRDSAATLVNSKGLIEQVGYFGPELVQNGNFSELGSELIPDGNFTNQAAVDYWSIAATDGVERATKSLENGFMRLTYDIANGSALYKSSILPSGKSYKVTFRAKGTANSNFNSIGDNVNIPSNPQYVVSNPTLTDDWQDYEFYVPVSSTTLRLYLTSAQIGDTLDITNISVKQVDPNDYWYASDPWSITNQGAFYDDTSGNRLDQSNLNLVQNKLYKLTFDIENTTGTEAYIWIGNSGGTVPYVGTWYQSYSTGSNTVYFTMPSNQTALAFYGSQTGGLFYINNISLVEVKGDKPRIDYTDSLTSPSFLLEPQSTNLVEFSEDFSKWAKQSGGTGLSPIITLNDTISPDGTQNADKVVFNKGTGTTTSDLSILQASFTSQSNTASIYVKADSSQRIVIRNSSTWVGYDIGTEWTRIEKTDTGGSIQIGLRDGYGIANVPDTATVYLWGAQIEALSYATSYIPTAGSTVTRAKETCNGAGNVSTFNSTEGVLYAEIAALANQAGYRYIALTDGTVVNRVDILYRNDLANTVTSRLKAGTDQARFDILIDNELNYNKFAISWKQNEVKFFVNGVQQGSTDTNANVPPANTFNELLFHRGDNLEEFFGKVKGVYVFNKALTDDELQQLTGPEYNSFAALAAAYNYTVI
jgi:hypothetical protein